MQSPSRTLTAAPRPTAPIPARPPNPSRWSTPAAAGRERAWTGPAVAATKRCLVEVTGFDRLGNVVGSDRSPRQFTIAPSP